MTRTVPEVATPEMIARALLNARGARNGMPAIANVETLVGPKVWADALDDARAALAAAPPPSSPWQGIESQLERAVFDWIRDDAPLTVKMTLRPEHWRQLVSRLTRTLAPPPPTDERGAS